MAIIQLLLERMLHGDFERAYDQASRIADSAALEEIRLILERSRDPREKKYCYWILHHIGSNSGDPAVVDYLMERSGVERTAALRKLALHEVFFLGGASNPDPAIAALGDKRRDVRHSAIAALGGCRHAKSEQMLIEIVSQDEDPVALREATRALARIGTERCAPALAALFRRLPRNRQHEATVAAALLGLTRIGPLDSLPLAVEELQIGRSGIVSWSGMLAIWRHGDERQIELVIRRLEALIARKKRQDLQYVWTMIDTSFGDELSAGVLFLQKFADPRIDAFFEVLRARQDRLFARERNFLAAQLPGFGTPSG